MPDFIVDAALVLVVLIGTVIGYKRGFVAFIAKPLKFVLSIGLSFGYATRFAASVVTPMIEAPATNYIKEFLYTNCQNITAENVKEELPTMLKIAAATFNVDVSQVANDATGTVVDALADKLTSPVIGVISTVISFVVLLIILNVVLSVAIGFIKALFKNGVLGFFNKGLGLVFGFAFSFVVAWALAVGFDFAIHLPVLADNAWIQSFEGGAIYRFLNEYNPIELLLSF